MAGHSYGALSSPLFFLLLCLTPSFQLVLEPQEEAPTAPPQHSIMFEYGGCKALNSQCCPNGCSFPGGSCPRSGPCGSQSQNFTAAGELISGHCIYSYDPATCQVTTRTQGCQVVGVCTATYDCACWVCNKICTGQPKPDNSGSASASQQHSNNSDDEPNSESGSAGRYLPLSMKK
ncbi:hypothetical protein QOT17_019319 [Balamuthia mandrillaris]